MFPLQPHNPELITVFRVEGPDGYGPFTRVGCYAIIQEAGLNERHYIDLPDPREDGIPDFSYSHRCACASEAQLLRWFPPRALRFLQQRGYTVYAIDVEAAAVQFGRHQVAFHRAFIHSRQPYEPSHAPR